MSSVSSVGPVAATPHATPALPVQLLVAGPPRLRRAGSELHPGTRKALALALLATLDPGVRRSTVADLLWPDADPAASRRNLRRDLFRLRQLGLEIRTEADALQAEGVALQWPQPSAVPPRWLDGLDEVAGPEWSHWVEVQRLALHSRWLAQLAQAAQRLEDEGRGREALQAWKGLLADGAGGPGQAEARAGVQRLQGESDDVRHDAAGTNAPASTAARRAAGRSPLPFVGRAVERSTIAAALGRCRLVLLDGSPGVGKTRLALEALGPLAAPGGVLLLRCRPEDAAVPYASALRGLHLLREAAPDTTLPRVLRRELAALVPDWTSGIGEPELAPLATVHRAYHQALQLLADGNFGALVIDDWQWADAASQALWEPQARPSGALPCLVVHRSGELAPAALQQRRRWLDAGLAAAVHVPPLSDAESRELLDAVAAAQRSAAAAGANAQQPDALAQRSAPALAEAQRAALAQAAGNPLILIETLRAGGTGTANDGSLTGRMPPAAGVRRLFVERVRALGPAVRRVLEAASLADDDLRPAVLTAAAGIDELAVVQALEHALAAELLVAGERGRVHFAHELIEEAVAETQSPMRRATVHGQLAAGLAALGAEPGRIARHLDLADRGAEAAAWHLRAAHVALQRMAWPAVLADCAAVRAASAEPAQRCEACLLAARAHWRLSDVHAAEAAIDAARADAVRAGPAWIIDTALERCELLTAFGSAEDSLADLSRLADDPALAPAQRRRVLCEQASALSHLGRHAQSLPLLRELLDALPPSALAERQRTLDLLARNLYWSGELGEMREVLSQALAHSRAMGDDAAAMKIAYRLGASAREAGEIATASAHLEQVIRLSRGGPLVELLRSALSTLATIKLDRMQLDDAEALLVEGEQAASGWESPNLEDVYDQRRLRLYRLRGDLAAAWAVMQRSLRRNESQTHLHSVLGTLAEAADLALASGDLAAARGYLGRARQLHAGIGAESLHSRLIDAHEIQLLHAEGSAAEALSLAERWLAADKPRRVEEHARVLISAARAAAVLARHAQAVALLAESQKLPGLPQGLEALRWMARLALCGAEGRADTVGAARQWLAEGARPPLEAAQLRAALVEAAAAVKPHDA